LLRSATHCRLSYVREKRYNKTKRAAARRAASPAATGSPPTRPPASSSTDHPPAHRHLAAYPPETPSPEPAWQSSRYAVQPARPSFALARSSWPVTPARRRRHGSVGTNGVCGTNLVLWLTRWVIREDRWYGRLVPPWSMMTAGGADARLVGAPSRAVASAVGVDGRLGPGDSRWLGVRGWRGDRSYLLGAVGHAEPMTRAVRFDHHGALDAGGAEQRVVE